MSVINPQGFDSFMDWADQMSTLIDSDVPQFARMMPAVDRDNSEEAWRQWAMCIVGGQNRLGQDSPNPYYFDNWREWAERLFETQDFAG